MGIVDGGQDVRQVGWLIGKRQRRYAGLKLDSKTGSDYR